MPLRGLFATGGVVLETGSVGGCLFSGELEEISSRRSRLAREAHTLTIGLRPDRVRLRDQPDRIESSVSVDTSLRVHLGHGSLQMARLFDL